jgi:hypothetical protein
MKSFVKLLVSSSVVLALAGCRSTKTVGVPAPLSVQPVPLQQLLDNPAQYHGQVVVLEGVVSGQCGSLCEFFYSEKKRSATILMGDLKAVRIKTGTPVRVTVRVFNGERQAVLTAVGFVLSGKG